jgi:hypothetical protein
VKRRFAAIGADGPAADALVERCDGWAAAIAFVEHEIASGVAPHALLARNDAWSPLWMYAARNVIDVLDAESAADLSAIACTPDATITDFARDVDCSIFDARRRVEHLPFVELDDRGNLTVSPLVLAMWRYTRPAELAAKAQALAARRQPSAAIATLLRGGDMFGAAQRAEQSIEVIPALDAQSHALLAELPQSVLRSHPRLWLSVGMPRWWHDDPGELINTAAAALDAAAREDIDTRFGLMLMVMGGLIATGQRERASVLVERLASDARASASAPHHAILASMIDAAWLTFDERDFDLTAVREACSPLFASPSMYLLYLLMPLWTWCRIHGRLGEALEASEQAIAAAREMMPGMHLDALGGAVYSAWLAGDSVAFERLLAQHREVLEMHRLHAAHGFFARAATGDPASDEARAYVRPWFLCEGLLMRAALRNEAADAKRDIEESIVISRRLGFREVTLTAYVALATFDVAFRYEHLREAVRLAEQIGTVELRSAVEALAISDARQAQHYQPIVGYFSPLRTEALRISFADRTIEHAGRTHRLSQQQFAIMAMIELSSDPLSRRELGELVSSDGAMVPEAVLEVQLARLRRRFGAEVILHDGGGYRFGIPVTSDWSETMNALPIVHDPTIVQRRLDEISRHVAHRYETATTLRAAESRIAASMPASSHSVTGSNVPER